MATGNKEKFDLRIVHQHFSSALRDENDVEIKGYLDSYEELNKFFTLMGSIFGFVSQDLKEKIDILTEFLQKESENFKTVKTMIEYEKTKQLLKKKNYTSASRTLLRLHRGLDFIREFLRRLGELSNEENTGSVCRDAYSKTLANYHPFVIRTGAQIAMYTLPTREVLLQKVCGDEEDIRQNLAILQDTLDATATVYNRIESLYTEHDLHSLP